ncbi:PREDICTED: atrophin-1-like [Hipposideros armiger]|uniref:Atrophin-1-like n=1 Tax=Hipposideros armiger TaxID=186990 RepID=A0A8B7RC09_HIPAR|nr:PREDICTED: atrophin-1-like [Hipposideros armiger]
MHGESQYPHFRDRDSVKSGKTGTAPSWSEWGLELGSVGREPAAPHAGSLKIGPGSASGAVASGHSGRHPLARRQGPRPGRGRGAAGGVLRLRFPEEKARPAPLTGGDAAAQASFSSRPRPPGLEPLNPHPALRAPAFPPTRSRRRLPRHVPPLHSPGMRRTSNRPTDHGHRAPSLSPRTEQRPLESPHHFRPSRRSTPIGQGRSGCRPIG